MNTQQEQGGAGAVINVADAAEKKGFDVKDLFGIAGFAFFLSWTVSILTNPLLFLSFSQFGDSFYIRVFSLIIILLVLLISFLSHSFEFAFARLWSLLFILACCSPIGGLAGYFFSFNLGAQLLLWTLGGIGTATLFLCWGTFLSSLHHIKALAYPALSAALAMVFLAFGMAMLETAAVVGTLLMPVFSLLLYLPSFRGGGCEAGIALGRCAPGGAG